MGDAANASARLVPSGPRGNPSPALHPSAERIVRPPTRSPERSIAPDHSGRTGQAGSGSSRRQPKQRLSPLLSRRSETPALCDPAKARRPRSRPGEAPAQGQRQTPSTIAVKRGVMITPQSNHLTHPSRTSRNDSPRSFPLRQPAGIEAAKRFLTALCGQESNSGARRCR